ncbi:hypothetical protein QYE76_034333 [Lolium multiflorum]|uniref:CCHC-type domain-containing protein n=1 Tax=Lolium multiflorum TaxID=4521 RepID=A0AAD8QYH3_LOLMU|nr:hypothetical protein QYE76_034333 [Lolium multiflorum]
MGPAIPKYRNNSSGGYTTKYNKPTAQTYRPNYINNQGGPPKPGDNNNNNHNNTTNPNSNNTNGNNNNNTGPKTGSNTVPFNPKDKSTITCYECGVVGHYSNECPKRLAKIAGNTAAPAQNQRRFAARKNQNNNGRYYNMTATEAQEAPQAMPTPATVEEELDTGQTSARPWRPACRGRRTRARHGHPLATRRTAPLITPWTPFLHQARRRDTSAAPDTRPAQTRDRRRRRRRPHPVNTAAVVEAMRPNQALPNQAVAAIRLAWTRRTPLHPCLAQHLAGIALLTAPQHPWPSINTAFPGRS